MDRVQRLAHLVKKYRMPPHKLANGFTPAQMQILALRAIGATHAEIAEALSKSPGTVQNTQWRAIRRLRKMAKERGIPCPAHISPAMIQRWVIQMGWLEEIEKMAELAEPPRVQQLQREASRHQWQNPL